MRTSLEVADIFRAASPAYRVAHAGHLNLQQLKVMSAIVQCRTAALGGHVEACTDWGHWRVAYNSCRNRHCPRCQGAARRRQCSRSRPIPSISVRGSASQRSCDGRVLSLAAHIHFLFYVLGTT